MKHFILRLLEYPNSDRVNHWALIGLDADGKEHGMMVVAGANEPKDIVELRFYNAFMEIGDWL